MCAGTATLGYTNVRGRPVTAFSVYNGSAGGLYVDGCEEQSAYLASASSAGVMIGSRGNQDGRWVREGRVLFVCASLCAPPPPPCTCM